MRLIYLIVLPAMMFGCTRRPVPDGSTAPSTNATLQARLDAESKWATEHNARGPKDSADEEQMRKILFEWARVASIPKKATDVRRVTAGGVFTRGFRAHFATTDSDLRKWIESSPALKDSKGEVDPDGWNVFHVKPGSGAGFAEVRIDPRVLFVVVYAYWS